MGLFIRSDADPYEKVLGLSILAIIALSIVGIFSRFIPNETYHFYATIISFPIAIFIFSLTIYQIKRNKKKYIGQNKSYMTRWYAIPIFALVWLFFSYITLTLGMPSLINHLIATDHQQTVTINKKSFGVSIKSRIVCRYRIHVKELKSFLNRALCTSKELHTSVELGDRLKLTGHKSWMGITVENFYIQQP